MRVLLADDEVRVRFALRVLLRQQPGIELAGEAARASELPEAIARIHPDLVLLDWDLSGATGKELLETIRCASPRLPVIVLSGKLDERAAALSAGADAFVCKTDSPDRLLAALTTCCGRVTRAPAMAYAAS